MYSNECIGMKDECGCSEVSMQVGDEDDERDDRIGDERDEYDEG